MKTKMKLLSVLTLSFASCLIAGVAGVRAPVTAHGAKIGDVSISSFEMQYGASLYKLNDGIRFTAQIDADEYTALEDFDESRTDVAIGYGMLITTKKYASQYELNAQNVFGVGGTAQYTCGGGTLPIVNKIASEMGKSSTASPLDPYLLYGTIIDAIPDNATPAQKQVWLQGEYVARAYIKYEVDGQNPQYVFANYAKDVAVGDSSQEDYLKNTRSMFQVALNRINAGDVASAELYDTYVKPVIGDTYTINTYIDTHTGHNSLMETVQVTGSTAVQDVLNSIQKDGYSGQKIEVVKDDSNITINCILQPNDAVISSNRNSTVLSIPGSNVFYVDQAINFNTVKLGLYYNATGETWTLNSEGTGGQVAVLNESGELIEARDGDNGKLVNGQYPIRVTSPKVGGLENVYAKNISVPVAHFVVIIPGGTTYTTERAFMREYVSNEYQNTIQIHLQGANNPLTQYVDHADAFGCDEVLINAGRFTQAEVDARMLAGITTHNDSRTFDSSDDVKGYQLSIVSNGGANVNAVGTYTYTIQATKEGYETMTFERVLTVVPATNDVRMYIKDRSATRGSVYLMDSFQATGTVLVDDDSTLTSYSPVTNSTLTIYSYDYLKTGKGKTYAGNEHIQYGVAFLVNKSGKILEIFNGAHSGTEGKYYGSHGYTCTNTGYTTQAISAFKASVYEGGYLIIAPNNDANSVDADGKRGSRTFLQANLVLNRYVELTNILFSY